MVRAASSLACDEQPATPRNHPAVVFGPWGCRRACCVAQFLPVSRIRQIGELAMTRGGFLFRLTSQRRVSSSRGSASAYRYIVLPQAEKPWRRANHQAHKPGGGQTSPRNRIAIDVHAAVPRNQGFVRISIAPLLGG